MRCLTDWERRVLGEDEDPIEPREGERKGMMVDLTASLKDLKTQIETTPFIVDLSVSGPRVEEILKCYWRLR